MTELPLRKAIEGYAARHTARFHMPGHKGVLSQTDVTEVAGTDNLHSPNGALLRSEALCAEAMGARDAFFLVNGSTAGNLAMLFLAGCGNRILLGRSCHRSVLNGVALADQKTVPLFPDTNGVYSAEAVDRALSENPCSAVFITSPTYRGTVSDIEGIAAAAHRHGALLLVDAAHGAHFAFSDALPPIPCGADLWCVSTHKTLCAFTQSALLLAGESCPFSTCEIQRALNMFQSTSPSYELMLSIESSVLEPGDWDAHIKRIRGIRRELEAMPGVALIGADEPSLQDISRLNISFSGMNGHALSSELERAGVVPEMADLECVTLITSPCDPDEWYERLLLTLRGLRFAASSADERMNGVDLSTCSGEAVLSVRDAFTFERELIAPEMCVGRVCAGAVGCYPPGVAVLFPGERITEDAVRCLLCELDSGAELFGTDNGLIPVIKDM